MSNTSSASVQVGPGGATLIFITLLLLKVFGYVDWSWWIITAPLWAGLAVLAGIGVVILITLGVARLLDARADRKRKKRRAARLEGQKLTTRNRL